MRQGILGLVTVKCAAAVRPSSLTIRARTSPTDPNCQRNAKFHGRCYQHATDHHRIVQRILEIPARD